MCRLMEQTCERNYADIVQLFDSQFGDGTIVAEIRGNDDQLEMVWSLFKTAPEFQGIRDHFDALQVPRELCTEGVCLRHFDIGCLE